MPKACPGNGQASQDDTGPPVDHVDPRVVRLTQVEAAVRSGRHLRDPLPHRGGGRDRGGPGLDAAQRPGSLARHIDGPGLHPRVGECQDETGKEHRAQRSHRAVLPSRRAFRPLSPLLK